MIAAFKRFLRLRRVTRIHRELTSVRLLRMDCTAREFTLRGQLDLAEAAL